MPTDIPIGPAAALRLSRAGSPGPLLRRFARHLSLFTRPVSEAPPPPSLEEAAEIARLAGLGNPDAALALLVYSALFDAFAFNCPDLFRDGVFSVDGPEEFVDDYEAKVELMAPWHERLMELAELAGRCCDTELVAALGTLSCGEPGSLRLAALTRAIELTCHISTGTHSGPMTLAGALVESGDPATCLRALPIIEGQLGAAAGLGEDHAHQLVWLTREFLAALPAHGAMLVPALVAACRVNRAMLCCGLDARSDERANALPAAELLWRLDLTTGLLEAADDTVDPLLVAASEHELACLLLLGGDFAGGVCHEKSLAYARCAGRRCTGLDADLARDCAATELHALVRLGRDGEAISVARRLGTAGAYLYLACRSASEPERLRARRWLEEGAAVDDGEPECGDDHDDTREYECVVALAVLAALDGAAIQLPDDEVHGESFVLMLLDCFGPDAARERVAAILENAQPAGLGGIAGAAARFGLRGAGIAC